MRTRTPTRRTANLALVAAGLLLLAASSAKAQGQVSFQTTPQRPFTTGAGVVIDVTALTPITIYRVAVPTHARSGQAPSTEPIEVWIRHTGAGTSPGVHTPFVDQPTGWTLAGRADVAFSSSGGLTEVPVDLNAFLRTGEKIGIAVYSNTHSNGIRAENPAQGTTAFSDGNVLLDSRENILYAEQVSLLATVPHTAYFARRDQVNALIEMRYDLSSTPGRTFPSVTTTALPTATAWEVYTWTLRATGGSAPYTFQASGLPAGLQLQPSTGLVTGIPSRAGSSTVDVTVTDSRGQAARRQLLLTVDPAAAVSRLSITTPPTLPDALEGVLYDHTLTTQGQAAGGVQWSFAGPRFPWLRLDAQTGRLWGVAGSMHAGAFTLRIVADDSVSRTEQPFQITVRARPAGLAPLSVLTTALPGATAGSSFRATLDATGGVAPYSWTAGGLPRGLTFDPRSGTIDGVIATAGRFSVATKVTDAQGAEALRSFILEVGIAASPLVITTAILPDGTVGQLYGGSLAATGGVSPYRWSILRPVGLPPGLFLDAASGRITGAPTVDGTRQINFRVEDQAGTRVDRVVTVIVRVASGGGTGTGSSTSPGTTSFARSGGGGGGCAFGGQDQRGSLLLWTLLVALAAGSRTAATRWSELRTAR